MKIIRLIVLLSVAFAVLGGCAAREISDGDMALERASKVQALDQNENIINRDCVTNYASIKVAAQAVAEQEALMAVGPSIESPKELTTLQKPLYASEYRKVYKREIDRLEKLSCLEGQDGASTDGGRYGTLPAFLAGMSMEGQCRWANSLMRSLMGKEIANVDEVPAAPGTATEYAKTLMRGDCDRWFDRVDAEREFRLEQQRIDKQAEVEKHYIEETTPPWWSRFIAPRSYRGHSAVKVNVWYDRSGSRSYRGAPSDARRDLMEDAGYNRWGQHKNNYRGLNWWKKY